MNGSRRRPTMSGWPPPLSTLAPVTRGDCGTARRVSVFACHALVALVLLFVQLARLDADTLNAGDVLLAIACGLVFLTCSGLACASAGSLTTAHTYQPVAP